MLCLSLAWIIACGPVNSGSQNGNRKTELYRSSASPGSYMVIYKTKNNNCGCSTVDVENYVNGRLSFSVAYSCPKGMFPYRQDFVYDNENNIVSKTCLRATDDEKFDTPFTAEDLRIDAIIDSLSAAEKDMGAHEKICLRSTKGYNRIDCVH